MELPVLDGWPLVTSFLTRFESSCLFARPPLSHGDKWLRWPCVALRPRFDPLEILFETGTSR